MDLQALALSLIYVDPGDGAQDQQSVPLPTEPSHLPSDSVL